MKTGSIGSMLCRGVWSKRPSTLLVLCVLRHCREHPSIATGASGRSAVLAHHAQQSEWEGRGLVEAIPTDQGAVSIRATKTVSPLLGVASSRRAVNQLLKSVVREICMLRSGGAGGGQPASATRWAASDGCPPCRDHQSTVPRRDALPLTPNVSRRR